MPKTIGSKPNRNSWLNFCEPTEIKLIKGSFKNPERTGYFELFIPPTIPSSENDIRHIVSNHERVDLIAHKYYGTSELWWVIAERNNIDLPIAELRRGMELIIPARSVVELVISKV